MITDTDVIIEALRHCAAEWLSLSRFYDDKALSPSVAMLCRQWAVKAKALYTRLEKERIS